MAWSSAAGDYYCRQRRLAAMKEHQRRIECLDNLELTGELFDHNGFDLDGFDRNGYDKDGYDRDGYDRHGYDRRGFDREGFNRYGFDEYGNTNF